jgi:hypothetical protein
MEENIKKDNETTVEKKEPEFERDWFLQTLVNMANSSTSKGLFGITLLTHGFLVSGMLVNGREYFNGFAEDIASGLDDSETAKSIKENFVTMGNSVYDKRDNDDNLPPPTYIHLFDAKFFHPNGQPIPANKGVWWRGRISEISGFSLGSLSIPIENT